MVSLYNKVIIDFSLAKRFFIDPPDADNFIVSFIRYYGITADRYEDAIKMIEKDVKTEGELFYAECAEVPMTIFGQSCLIQAYHSLPLAFGIKAAGFYSVNRCEMTKSER